MYNLTYDPDAELYAKKAELEKEKSTTAAKSAKKAKEAAKIKAAADEIAATDAERAAAERERRQTFSTSGAVGEALKISMQIFVVFLIFGLCILGASLATNLNVYHSAPYRVFYAVYGFVFFFLVIPYVLGYRWWIQGKKPKFYALIPLVPYHFDHRLTAFLLSWISYKPDNQINLLKEWQH